MDIEVCRKIFETYRNGTIFAGFSGGADSTAALLVALYFQKEFNYRLEAVHFNHHLRGRESDDDALFCRDFAAQRDIPITIIDLNIASGPGMEEAARTARLEHWKRLAGKQSDAAVVLGHHADDRMENFFLRLIRGANLSGLLSPRGQDSLEQVNLLRPLLCFSKRDIEKFLTVRGIKWRTDSSNRIPDCARNRIRLQIIPALQDIFPGAAAGMEHAIRNLSQDADFLERSAAAAFDENKAATRSYWQDLHPALVPRVIRLWKNAIPGRDFLLRLEKELALPVPSEPRAVPWDEQHFLVFQHDRVFWLEQKKDSGSNESAIWNFSNGEFIWGKWIFSAETTDNSRVSSRYEAVFDADLLGEEVRISLPCPGDTMSVFGSGKTVKIKKLRVDLGIPAQPAHPLVKTLQGNIIWAPGIRHSGFAPASKQSGRLLRLICRSPELGIGIGVD